jgi:TonB family protein
MLLPRICIATWLGLFLAAPLCLAQDQPKTGQDVQTAVLVHRVNPDYPSDWKREGLQGNVHLRATIAKDGSVKDITVVDGDARLLKSAEKALKQWRYKPATKNGEPVEVQTTVVIAFALKPAPR